MYFSNHKLVDCFSIVVHFQEQEAAFKRLLLEEDEAERRPRCSAETASENYGAVTHEKKKRPHRAVTARVVEPTPSSFGLSRYGAARNGFGAALNSDDEENLAIDDDMNFAQSNY